MTTPHSAPDPRHCLAANTLQPSVLFFSDSAVLVSEVRKLLSLAVELDEEEVYRIVNTVCEVLKDAPLAGYHCEMSVSAGKPDEDVLIPGAAVTVVSCREDPGCLGAGWVWKLFSKTELCYELARDPYSNDPIETGLTGVGYSSWHVPMRVNWRKKIAFNHYLVRIKPSRKRKGKQFIGSPQCRA